MVARPVCAITMCAVKFKPFNVVTQHCGGGQMCTAIHEECLMLQAPIAMRRRRANYMAFRRTEYSDDIV
jgi:hypothetical protein